MKLTRKQFEDLDALKGSQLVLQFYYPATLKDGSPQLGAFTMAPCHGRISDEYRILDYDKPSTVPITGKDQFLGDQQVAIPAIKKLIEASNPKPHDYDYLLFTPQDPKSDKHIYYEIKVVPTTSFAPPPIYTDPSPPAKAN